MGPEPDLFAVADSGPLIHLNQIGVLPLLGVFSAVHIPNAVWAETVGRGRVRGPDLENAAVVQRHEIDSRSLAQFTGGWERPLLHTGEMEALLLCRRLTSPVLLTDDLAAREAAERLGVRPVGSLGIVIRAYHIGRIPLTFAEDCIHRLYRVSSLFVAEAIAEMAIERLRTL